MGAMGPPSHSPARHQVSPQRKPQRRPPRRRVDRGLRAPRGDCRRLTPRAARLALGRAPDSTGRASSGQCEARPSPSHGCGVGKAVLVLQPPELTLNGCAAPVQLAPTPTLARDQRVTTRSLHPLALGLALPSRAAPLGSVTLEVGPGECPEAVFTARRVVAGPAGRARQRASQRNDRDATALIQRVIEPDDLTLRPARTPRRRRADVRSFRTPRFRPRR